MSNTLAETIARDLPLEPARPQPRNWLRWPKRIFLLLVVLWLANQGISLLIQHSRLHKKITEKLESAFGRPVEVGSYSFSLWGSPTIEANSFVVAEDPRFGHEYFLRAETLTMSVRWQSLLRGHLEFGTISLSRPSLNLVRNSGDDWNLAEWLPRLSGSPGAASPSPASNAPPGALRFRRIEVDSGRINFKSADEKLPYAFVGVKGYLEPQGPGQWRMDLEAVPARAAVIIQQAGTLHLSGLVGGTSSRLRPAVLDLAWTGASIPDVLRLVRGTDYGLRGSLTISLNARTEALDWLLQGRTEIRQLHRWDLPLRGDNPSLNLIAKGAINLEQSRFDVVEALLETPHSNARASGGFSWAQPPANSLRPPRQSGAQDAAENFRQTAPQSALQVTSSGIDMADVLAWGRAFHPGTSDDIALRGFGKFDVTLRDWPLRLDDGALSVEHAELTGKSLPSPVRLTQASVRYSAKGVSLSPATLSFGVSGGSLHLETVNPWGAKTAPALRISGTLTDADDLISTARLLGWDISRGWDLTGPVRCDLKWQGPEYPWRVAPVGTLDLGSDPHSDSRNPVTGGSLRAPFLNLPIEQIRAHVDLKSDARHISLASADAFEAHWSGTLDRGDIADAWRFALSADRLAAADFDRWLNPRWRQSFLDRVLPFLNSKPPATLASAQPEYLLAAGKIGVDQFTLAPFVLRHMQADAAIKGRSITIADVRAQFYKGDLAGSLRAELSAIPSYRVSLDYSNVDLSALSAATASFADRFGGLASGEISIAARGASRADLLSSLQCRGSARINSPELKDINLTESLRERRFQPGPSQFREASAEFTCADSKLEFQRLLFSAPGADLSGQGTVDFSRRLDLAFTFLPVSPSSHAQQVSRDSESAGPPPVSRASSYRVSGNLSEPQISSIAVPASRP